MLDRPDTTPAPGVAGITDRLLLRHHSLHPAAPASRTFGRYAVGLRPILDPAASTERAQKRRNSRKEKSNPTTDGLDKAPLLQG